MQDSDVLKLIKYHVENKDEEFHKVAIEIAEDFAIRGNDQLYEYIMALVGKDPTLNADVGNDSDNEFIECVDTTYLVDIHLPTELITKIKGLITAIGNKVGIRKVLLFGPSGTGKTETVKQIARIMKRPLFIVNYDKVVSDDIEQTKHNIKIICNRILENARYSKLLILMDGIECIDSNSLMQQRKNSTLVLLLEEFNKIFSSSDRVTLFATTNSAKNETLDSFD